MSPHHSCCSDVCVLLELPVAGASVAVILKYIMLRAGPCSHTLSRCCAGQTLVQGAGELTNPATTMLASPPPPPPPPPFVFVSAAPAEEPAIEPLSLTATQAAPLTEAAPAPEPAVVLLAAGVPDTQPTASPKAVPVPKAVPAKTLAPTRPAPVTPAPTKAAAPLPVPKGTPQPTAGKSMQLAEQQMPGSYAAQPGAAPVPKATPRPTALVSSACPKLRPTLDLQAGRAGAVAAPDACQTYIRGAEWHPAQHGQYMSRCSMSVLATCTQLHVF